MTTKFTRVGEDDTMAWWLVGKKEGLGQEGTVVGAERVVMKYR